MNESPPAGWAGQERPRHDEGRVLPGAAMGVF